jgi:hypothetical protein
MKILLGEVLPGHDACQTASVPRVRFVDDRDWWEPLPRPAPPERRERPEPAG